MIRRDFLKTLVAAASAFAVAKSTAIALPTPPKPDDHEGLIRRMLAECVVIGFGRSCTVDGVCTWEVQYLHDPDRRYIGAHLNDELARMMPKDAGMRSVSIESTCDVDPVLLGDYQSLSSEFSHRVTVEWITA